MSSIFFLNSSFLLLLIPLLGLPLIIHLLNKKFPQLFFFSSIELIKKSVAERSKLFQKRHLILLLVRTLLLICLLLVFLNPVMQMFGGNASKKGARHIVIVLDRSLSMNYKGGSISPAKKGLVEVRKIIDSLSGKDKVNLIVVGKNVELCFPQMSLNHMGVFTYLNSMKPGISQANFTQSLVLTAKQFSAVTGKKELYVVSDFQRKNWAEVSFDSIDKDVTTYFIDVSQKFTKNRAIIQAKSLHKKVLKGDEMIIEVLLGNYSDQAFNDKVEVAVDGKYFFEEPCQVPPWSVSKTIVKIKVNDLGHHVCKVSIADDDLLVDNQYFLTIQSTDKEEVLVLSDGNTDENDAVKYVKTALNPFENNGGSISPKVVKSADISKIHLVTTNKVFVSKAGVLDQKKSSLICDFVLSGGSMVYFLDGNDDALNLKRMDQGFGGKSLPLKLSQKQNSKSISGGAQQVISGNFRSKYLNVFRGALRSNLSLLEFYEYYHAMPTGQGEILLTFADGTPAMAVVHVGLGTILFCNFSLNELSSNLARQKIFPAWVQEMVKTMDSGESASDGFLVGDQILFEAWRDELNYPVKSPTGNEVYLKRSLKGDRITVMFDADEQGVYTLSDGKEKLYAFAVNIPANESDLRSIDPQRLNERLGSSQGGFTISGQKDYSVVKFGQPIFHWLLILGLFLMFLELFLFKFFKVLSR